MEKARTILSRYEICLTCAEKFDVAENTGYTTYGVLIRDNEGQTLFEVEDFHTDKSKVQYFIGRLVDPEHLHELVEEFLDGCDDLDRAGELNYA